MKKFLTLVILVISLVSTAYADYQTHPDIYFPYEEINVGDVFWTSNCFTYYPRANGSSGGLECYDDQSVIVVSKADEYSDHPIYVSGTSAEGWVDMDFFYCRMSESNWSVYEDYQISYDDLRVGNRFMFHGDRVYRYANGFKKYTNVEEESVYVEVVDKYFENSDHPIQIKSLTSINGSDEYTYDGEYYGWVNIEDLYAYGGNW